MTPEQRAAIQHALYHAAGDFSEWSQNHAVGQAEQAQCWSEHEALFAQVRDAFDDQTLDGVDQETP